MKDPDHQAMSQSLLEVVQMVADETIEEGENKDDHRLAILLHALLIINHEISDHCVSTNLKRSKT